MSHPSATYFTKGCSIGQVTFCCWKSACLYWRSFWSARWNCPYFAAAEAESLFAAFEAARCYVNSDIFSLKSSWFPLLTASRWSSHQQEVAGTSNFTGLTPSVWRDYGRIVYSRHRFSCFIITFEESLWGCSLLYWQRYCSWNSCWNLYYSFNYCCLYCWYSLFQKLIHVIS